MTTIDLQPYVIYRQSEGRGYCAVWQMEVGHQALAPFSDFQAAEKYADECLSSTAGWSKLLPDRAGLWKLLEAAVEAGILYAVLDPQGSTARKVFDLPEVLASDPAGGPG